jgi:ComF family protein
VNGDLPVTTPLVFGGAVAEAIGRLKYEGRIFVARVLVDATAYAWRDLKVDGVVAVPLHPSRELERGYNQASLVARHIARHLGVPVLPTAVRRVRPTPPQVGLGRAMRLRNLERAFAPGPSPRLDAMRILVVDDVVTTGATLRTVADVLRAMGARFAIGAALARADV